MRHESQGPLERASRTAAKGVFATADMFLGRWPGPRILIYHQIVRDPVREMDLDPAAFARHIRWLSDRGRFVTLEQALADPGQEGSSRDHVLTFDDGYRGLFEHAFPILREQEIPFVLYVTSQLVDGRPGDDAAALDWDQVNQMKESGLLTVGAHTHTHPDLRELTADQVEEEIDISNELIEERTGVRPRHFAYTKGYWSPVAEPILRDRYDTAVLGAGAPITPATDHYRLSRIPVQRGDGYFFFKRKVVRGMRLEEWVRSRLKGYRNPAALSTHTSKVPGRRGTTLGIGLIALATAITLLVITAPMATAAMSPGDSQVELAAQNEGAYQPPPNVDRAAPPWLDQFAPIARLPLWAQAAVLSAGVAAFFIIIPTSARFIWGVVSNDRFGRESEE